MEFTNIMETLLKKLTAVNKLESVSFAFKLLINNEERIIYTLHTMSKYNITPPDISKTKNSIDAKIFREKGNKQFVTNPITSKRCVNAFELYTKSIAFSPCQSVELALAYGNRSAVLLKMRKYSECIEDIDRALALTYPDHLGAKLQVRKLECLFMLNDPNVKEVCDEVHNLLEKMSLEDVNREKLKIKLKTLCSTQKHGTSVTPKKEESMIAPPLKSQNPEAVCASGTVTIKYTKELGRHVIASQTIHPGEVIAIEKPYSLLLKVPKIYTHCGNCLKMCWSTIPCNHCVYAMYCSENCRVAHWKAYHDVECSVFGHLIELNCVMLDLFSLRLAIQAVREVENMDELRNETKEVDEWSDPRTVGFANDGKLYSNKYRGVYGLATNVEKRSVSDLFRRTIDSCSILYYLATKTDFFGCKLKANMVEWASNRDITFVGSLILQHQMTIPTNMHDFGEVYLLDHESYGVGALPFCSLVNHSCSPNVSRYNRRDKSMVLFALYPIQKGEQLFDNYGQLYAMTPKKQRQQRMLSQYYFHCNCLPCEMDWPLYFHMKSYKNLVSNQEHREKIRVVLLKFDHYVDLATNGDVSSEPHIVEDLLKMIEVLCDYAPIPSTELSDVIETLKRVYDLKYGNIFEIPSIS